MIFEQYRTGTNLFIICLFRYRDSSYDWQDGGRGGGLGGWAGIKSKMKKSKNNQQPEDLNGHTNDISGNESGIL